MYSVYILRSINHPERLYIGMTDNLQQRLAQHHSNTSMYSRRYSPWEVETHIVFKDRPVAQGFETYLKSGSGFAFLKRRLLPDRIWGVSREHATSDGRT